MQNYGGMNMVFLWHYTPLNPCKNGKNKGAKWYYTPCNRT